MKRLILVLLLCAAEVGVRAQESDSLLVMFWNLENFFDWKNQETGESDEDFSSFGSKSWTRSRFYFKCNSIAKSLFWVSDKYGRMPDVFGVCEVENKGVLTRMLSSTLLRKYDYEIVHFESQDRRGIDVALLYRRSSLSLISTSLTTPESDGKKINTRDMLHVRLGCASTNNTIDFIVCHHPSKYGGSEQSQHGRSAAMTSLAGLCDSLGSTPKVIMGDFNDSPDAYQFKDVSTFLVNKSDELHKNGEGTIRFKGKWELIDMFLVDDSLESFTKMDILKLPFLMVYDRSYPGYKPLRTYSGPKYLGGVSDHCPIILKILLPLGDFK
jgi:exonuclease III